MLDLFGAKTNKKVGIICSDDPDGQGWYHAVRTGPEEGGL